MGKLLSKLSCHDESTVLVAQVTDDDTKCAAALENHRQQLQEQQGLLPARLAACDEVAETLLHQEKQQKAHLVLRKRKLMEKQMELVGKLLADLDHMLSKPELRKQSVQINETIRDCRVTLRDVQEEVLVQDLHILLNEDAASTEFQEKLGSLLDQSLNDADEEAVAVYLVNTVEPDQGSHSASTQPYDIAEDAVSGAQKAEPPEPLTQAGAEADTESIAVVTRSADPPGLETLEACPPGVDTLVAGPAGTRASEGTGGVQTGVSETRAAPAVLQAMPVPVGVEQAAVEAEISNAKALPLNGASGTPNSETIGIAEETAEVRPLNVGIEGTTISEETALAGEASKAGPSSVGSGAAKSQAVGQEQLEGVTVSTTGKPVETRAIVGKATEIAVGVEAITPTVQAEPPTVQAEPPTVQADSPVAQPVPPIAQPEPTVQPEPQAAEPEVPVSSLEDVVLEVDGVSE